MDQAARNTLDRISEWVLHAGPTIDNLPPEQLTEWHAWAFNQDMGNEPVPAIDPLRILALVPPPLNHGHELLGEWVEGQAAIANDNSYYHVTDQQHGRGRFRMLAGNDFQAQQHALNAIRSVLHAARWIVNNRAQVAHEDDDAAMDLGPDAQQEPLLGGRRSRRNQNQKYKKSRRSMISRKRRRTKVVKHRKKSRRHSTKRHSKKSRRRMTRKSK